MYIKVNIVLDVDECLVGTHSCQRNQVCVNVVGSFKCETRRPNPGSSHCRSGFGYNQLTRVCEGTFSEIFVPLCAFKMKRLLVSFVLLCLRFVETNCVSLCCYLYRNYFADIDECSVNLDTCRRSDQDCVNTVGSFTCRRKPLTTNCPAGYEYSRISQTCEGNTFWCLNAKLYHSKT